MKIYIEDAEYIKTEKDAKQYMYSYIGDTALSVLISFISVCAYYQLARFFDKENMENPYDEIPKKRLKKALKYLYASCITWLLGGVILTTIFVNASVSYSSNAGFDFILYALLVAFIQFIIYLLEKGQLKKASKEA